MSLMVIAGWKPLLRSMAYETFLYSHIVFGMFVRALLRRTRYAGSF